MYIKKSEYETMKSVLANIKLQVDYLNKKLREVK